MNTSIIDIVKKELCIGCGACISESNNSEMIWNDEGFLVPDISKEFKSKAIKLCPFNPQLDEQVKDEDAIANLFLCNARKSDIRIGRYNKIYAGFSKTYRETSSSGGIATYVLEELLQQGIVDKLIVVKGSNGTYEYQLFDDIDNIKNISKTRYIPVTLAKIFEELNNIQCKVAIVGVACFVKAIRLKQYYHPDLKQKIPFVIGIICGGQKSRFYTDYLAQKAGINNGFSNQEYRIKDPLSTATDYSFGAYDENTNFHQIKMSQLGDMWGTGLFKNNACDFCDDVTTELADISLGDAWLSPYQQDGLGNNVIITRSTIADNILERGIIENELDLREMDIETFKRSQLGSFRHRQIALKYRIKLNPNNKIINKRHKFLEDIPSEYKIVQKVRIELRRKSLEDWKIANNASEYDQILEKTKKKLRNTTRLYHIIQKIRKKLKIRTI